MRYLALLRGVNVGGATSVAMADLRKIVEGLGYRDVATYVQSGNVVLDGDSDDEAAVRADLRAGISEGLGRPIDLVLRSRPGLDAVVAGNPFLGVQDDLTKLLVTFLEQEPDAGHAAALVPPAGETGVLELRGREVYVHVPDGYGRSKLGNVFVEKKSGVAGTTRNWKSVLKLRDMLS